ncbi:hypothetical protein D3C71_1944490 [compost metagenome]
MGVAIARAGDRHINGEHQRFHPGRFGTFERIAHKATVLQHVQLEPHGPIDGRRDFLYRTYRNRRQRKGNAFLRSSPGRLYLATTGIHAG